LERHTLVELNLPAERPLYSALGSERVSLMPTLDDAIARFSIIARNVLPDTQDQATNRTS
jgi:hypothetical protein